MTFADLNNRHAGQCCLICGSGPSLDRLDPSAIAGPRIYLNRAGFILPSEMGLTYWMVIDDVWGLKLPGPWAEHLAAVGDGTARQIGVFRDPLLAGSRLSPAPRLANVIPYQVLRGRFRERALSMSRDAVAASGQLYERIGSAATAVHLAWYMGCTRLRLAGIDGGRGHAAALAGHYPGPPADYSTPWRWAMRAIQGLSLEVERV